MWEIARRPRWIVGHVVALTAIVVFLRLGFWQLDRLDERDAANDDVRAARAVPELVVTTGFTAEPTEYQAVRVSGEWQTDADILVRNRSLDGVGGFHVVTPLELADGTSLLVRRGFVLRGAVEDGRLTTPPVAGPVTVSGLMRAAESELRFTDIGWIDATPTTNAVVGWVDVAVIGKEIGRELTVAGGEFFVELADADPTASDAPTPLPEPDLDRGPHLSYAVQWMLFAAVVAIGYPLILRRAARDAGLTVESDPDGDGVR